MSKTGKLSKRLSAAAELVPEGAALVDIGTDHGFLPIELMEKERIKSAIAMDVGKGPLSRAKAHIREAGLEGRIETRLSDGFTALAPGEADTATILGMGGALIQKILTRHNPKDLGLHTLILGAQSEVTELRHFLLEEGYRIETERLIEEDQKFYFLLRVRTDEPEPIPYTEAEYLYGRSLLATGDPTLTDFLTYRKKVLEGIAASLKQMTSHPDRLSEIEHELSIISEVRRSFTQ